MGIFSSPPTPKPPKPITLPGPPPTSVDPGVIAARQAILQRARAQGPIGNIASSVQGVSTQATTTKKTLLGL